MARMHSKVITKSAVPHFNACALRQIYPNNPVPIRAKIRTMLNIICPINLPVLPKYPVSAMMGRIITRAITPPRMSHPRSFSPILFITEVLLNLIPGREMACQE